MKACLFSLLFLTLIYPLRAADKLKDFRGTNQSLALIGVVSEFVDPGTEEKLLLEFRKRLNRYTKSFGQSSIESFKIGNNPGKQFFKPSPEAPSDSQKKFLQTTCKDNAVDILVLGTFRQVGEETEVEFQLYDPRIEVFSKIEKGRFHGLADASAFDLLVYRVMNYLDREGYVYNTPQDFLEPPLTQSSNNTKIGGNIAGAEDFSINPNDLASGNLVGEITTGGDKVPFWEKWWFITLIGSALATAGGLSYYFLVIDQPPTNANVGFVLP